MLQIISFSREEGCVGIFDSLDCSLLDASSEVPDSDTLTLTGDHSEGVVLLDYDVSYFEVACGVNGACGTTQSWQERIIKIIDFHKDRAFLEITDHQRLILVTVRHKTILIHPNAGNPNPLVISILPSAHPGAHIPYPACAIHRARDDPCEAVVQPFQLRNASAMPSHQYS